MPEAGLKTLDDVATCAWVGVLIHAPVEAVEALADGDSDGHRIGRRILGPIEEQVLRTRRRFAATRVYIQVTRGPVRIVLSRKGFDSGSGGVPSPILDGALVSIPIPTSRRSVTTYDDIGLGNLVRDLTRGRIGASHFCHHDPDLRVGALGQVGRAQSHLEKNAVGPGDLLLFWGLFRRASLRSSGYRYVADAPREHWVFGWLQIGEVLHLGPDGSWAAGKFPKLIAHPHCRPGWPANNTLYLATEELHFGKVSLGLPGVGMFAKASEPLRLSVTDGPTSLWRVPRWLNPRHGGTGLTYHSSDNRWTDGTLQTVGRGQEFIATLVDPVDALAWLEVILEEAR